MKKRFILFLLCVFVIAILLSGFSLNKNNSKRYINKILSKESYNYLPEEAKDYIKKVYEETGELVLTEKNKEEELPYLNPDYVEYLKNGNNNKYGHIPEVFIVDHSYKSDKYTKKQGTPNQKASLSYYNLRDDGYITNIYDQGQEGLCWAFASTTSLESHLAIKSNKTKMLTFSEKQVDYATTNERYAIDIAINPFLNKDSIIGDFLSDGGNMLRYINAAAIGISPIKCDGNCSNNNTNYNSGNNITNNKYWKYDYSYSDKLSPYEITNIDNTEYSINDYLHYDPLTTDDQEEVDSLVNKLKEQIVTNGSLYVSVGAYTNLSIEYTPTGSESALNTNGKNIIYYIPYGWNPSNPTNHAVSVIGWDDNYTHTICLNQTDFELTDAKKVGNTYSCTKGTLYTINGAWIIQNSWGLDDSTFIYLPYNTMKSSYSSIADMSEVDYDNSYRTYSSNNTFAKGNNKESLNKIKVFVSSYNTTVSVYYNAKTNEIIIKDSYYSNNVTGTFLKSESYDLPGLHTIDLSDQNIIFDENTTSFKVRFVGNYLEYDYYGSIHTNNVNENEKYIDLTKVNKGDEKLLVKCNLNDNKCIDKPHSLVFDDNNLFIISGVSRNFSSSDNLTFKIFDQNQNNVTNLFHVFRNYSVSNDINAFISYNNANVSLGTYTIEVYFNDTKYDQIEWNLTKHNNVIAGIGTENDPYLIKTSSDLNDMRNHSELGNYFVLNNDIDLSYDTKDSHGLFYNSGKGWEPITNFYGNFDGNNHVISGLYINRPTDVSSNPVGLFSYITGEYNYIKNLILKDVDITGNYWAGALVGSVSVKTYIDISNISVVGGQVISSYYNGGLIGGISTNSGATEGVFCDLYNLYSNVIVGNTSTDFSGGIVGAIEGDGNLLSIDFTDSISYSKVSGDGSKGSGSIGGLAGFIAYMGDVTINSIIGAGSYKVQSDTRLGDIVGSIHDNNTVTINNTYYLDKIYGYSNNNGNMTLSDNYKKPLERILKYDYTNNFNDYSYWTKPVINGIKRLPMPSSLVSNFDFTDIVDELELKISETKNIYDLLYPTTNNAKNIEWTYDDEYLTINSSGVITPIKGGITTIHIDSLYDGYSKDVQVTITEMSTITFNSNNPSSETNIQEVIVGEDFNLEKNLFTYKGYKFKRWNTQADGKGISYTDEQLIEGGVNGNLVLYAIWDEITYRMTFYGNGGVSSWNKDPYNWDVNYPSNGTISFENIGFSMDNYVLDSWTTNQDGTGTKFNANISINFDEIPFDENYQIVLYAHWEEERYTITFNSNNGLGDMSDLELVKNVNANLPKNTFVREGYKFREWNTKSDGTGIIYTDEESLSITNNITLYAIWDEIIAEAPAYITTPFSGKHPDYTIETDGSGRYTVEINYWYLFEEPYPHLDNNYEYIEGKDYSIRISYHPSDGYVFDNNTHFTLNNQNTSSWGSLENREYLFENTETARMVIHTILNSVGGKYKLEYENSNNDPNEGNIMTNSGFYEILEGNEVTATAIPDDGYRFIGWYNIHEEDKDGHGTMMWVLDDLITTNTVYSFMPEGMIHISPVFEKNLETNIKNATVTNIPTKYYTGKALTPKPSVKMNDKTLKENVDYKLSYSNNKNIGTATITITGIGDYTGTKKVTFKIVQGITLNKTSMNIFKGDTFKLNAKVVGNESVTYTSSNTNIATVSSTGLVTANDIGTTNIKVTTSSGKLATVKVTVVPIKAEKVTINSIGNMRYTGKKLKPSLTIKYLGKKLVLGKDYTLSYKKNVNPGTAIIRVTFKGDYTGTKEIKFIILPASNKITKVSKSGTGKLKVTFSASTGATGYQIAYKKKGSSKWQYATTKSLYVNLKNLNKAKYEIKVRPYITINNKNYYGTWSPGKVVTVK